MKTTSPIRRISKVLLVLLICCGAVMLGKYFAERGNTNPVEQETFSEYKSEEIEKEEAEAEETDEAEIEEEPVFKSEPIPGEVCVKMMGVTISEESKMTFDKLSYLTITHIGYDGKNHTGNMIVDKELAKEVLEIFKELYEIRFPIEKIRPASEYDGVDELSMRDNNTSSFNDRPAAGGGGLSYHSLGRAIDINPLVNPYIKLSTGLVLPTNAAEYLDRTLDEIGMIKDGSECVKIFEKYGWTWGGNWNSVKDYQHFEKK